MKALLFGRERGFLAAMAWSMALSAPAAADPGFVLGWSLPAGSSSHGVALGDVDGDLDVDAYVSEFFFPDALWLNDGLGNFVNSGQLLDGGYGSCAILAPLDKNSSLDLFLSRHLQSHRVWFNNGTGTFTDSAQAIGASVSRRGAALGDLDGDGDLDAAVPTDNSSSTANEIFLNNGAGTFSDTAQSLGSYFSRAVALGDVDGDLDLDAMLGNNGANKLWLNNGAGVFTDSLQTVGLRGTFDVGLGDLDGDTDLDVYFANGSTSGDPDEVWFNNGSGVFTNSGQVFTGDYSFSVVLLNCDGDADLDAFVGNNSGQPNRLCLNSGAGVFTDSGEDVGIGGTISVAASDLDGDTDLDLFLANTDQPEQVFFNDGLCQFASSGQLLGSSSGESVDLGDVDGDGDLDALLGTYGGISRLLRNDGSGSFTDDDQWLAGGLGPSVGSVRLADFDGDLDLDLWTGLCCTGGLAADDPGDRIWLNDGSGVFTDSGQLLGSDYTTDGAVGDVDGDLDMDVVVANFPSLFSPGTNRLYRNNGAGVFTQGAQSLGTGDNTAVALGKLDGDSDLDLFFGVRGAASKVWRNNGAGFFVDSGQSLGSAVTYAVALGDLDRDLDLDAFLGNDGPNTVWFNDGNATFTDSLQALGSLTTVAVHLFDADGDSDLDAWTTNGGGNQQANEVWLNDGSGQFTDSGWSLSSSAFVASAIGNLDDDFDLDLLAVSFDGNHQVWLNQYSGPIFSDGFEAGTTNA